MTLTNFWNTVRIVSVAAPHYPVWCWQSFAGDKQLGVDYLINVYTLVQVFIFWSRSHHPVKHREWNLEEKDVFLCKHFAFTSNDLGLLGLNIKTSASKRWKKPKLLLLLLLYFDKDQNFIIWDLKNHYAGSVKPGQPESNFSELRLVNNGCIIRKLGKKTVTPHFRYRSAAFSREHWTETILQESWWNMCRDGHCTRWKWWLHMVSGSSHQGLGRINLTWALY